jgi:flagellar motor switch protein FliG
MEGDILELTGRKKAAILFVALGKDKSAKLFKHLTPDEIEHISFEIAHLGKVSKEIVQQVLQEYYEQLLAQNYMTEGGIEYARDLLEKTVGKEKAFEILSKLAATIKVRPFEYVRSVDFTQFFNLIQSEAPQTIAMIATYIPPQIAAKIIAQLPLDKQAEVAIAIANMSVMDGEAVSMVDKHLSDKMTKMQMSKQEITLDGISNIVAILNAADRATETGIFEQLDNLDPDLVERIKEKMFIFEDIITFDDRTLQIIIRHVENRDLVMALKGSSDELRDVIFRNVSVRLAAQMREDIDLLARVRKADVDEAQQKIVNAIRKLQADPSSGVVIGGKEEFL